MSMYAVQKTTVSLENFFNPYAGMGPPDCCYCAPTGVPANITNVTNITNQTVSPQQQQQQQQNIHIQVNAAIQQTIPGLSGLAFMTKTEDSMRTLERGRIEKRDNGWQWAQGVAEMGAGPYFYAKDPATKYVP